jgi:hypothetical protein
MCNSDEYRLSAHRPVSALGLDPECIRIEQPDSIISIQPPYCYVEWKGRWSRGAASFDGIDVSFAGNGSSFHIRDLIDRDDGISWEDVATRTNRSYQPLTAHYDYREDIDSPAVFEIPMNDSWSNTLNQHLARERRDFAWTVDKFRPAVQPPPAATAFTAIIRHEPTRLWIVSDWAKTRREIEYVRELSLVILHRASGNFDHTATFKRVEIAKEADGCEALVFNEGAEEVRAVFYDSRFAEGVLSVCTCPAMRPTRSVENERIHRLNSQECKAYPAKSLFYAEDLRWTGEFANVKPSDRFDRLTALEAYDKLRDADGIWVWWIGLSRWRYAKETRGWKTANGIYIKMSFTAPSIPDEELNLSLKSVRNRICCYPYIDSLNT